MPPERRSPRARHVTSGLVMAVAIGIMNVTTYGLTLVAARLLGPGEFGQFSAVLGVLMVVNVVSLGLQATAARRISTQPDRVDAIVARITRATWIAAVLVLVGCLVLTPAVTGVLNLSSWWSALMLAVAAAFLTVMGGMSGLLQGGESWRALAAVYVVMGVGRLSLGVAAVLLVDRSTAGAMTGVALGALLPAALSWILVRRIRTRVPAGHAPPTPSTAGPGRGTRRGSLRREVAHSSQALLAFFALSNADIVMARVVLPEHDSGLYAAGLILAKAVLFLPQFVVVVAFPAMAKNRESRRTHVLGLALVAGIGLIACGVVAALSPVALALTGGEEYAAVEGRLWVFAVLGTVLALVQLLVYSALAQSHGKAVLFLWAGLVGVLLGALRIDDVAGLLRLVIAVDVAVLALMVAVLLIAPARPRRPHTAPTEAVLTEESSSPEQPAVR